MTFETEVPTQDEFAARIESAHAWLVAEVDERVTGYAYASRFHPRAAYRWSAEVSIYLGETSRGRGLGRTLLRALLDEVTDRGFVNAFGGIALPNDASVSLFESEGFRRIALQEQVGYKLWAWHDVGWWQKKLRDPPIPPPEISPG